MCTSLHVNILILFLLFQVNAVKFNDYSTVVVSAGYDQSLRGWDCRSHSTEPIQVCSFQYEKCWSFGTNVFSRVEQINLIVM